MKYLNVICTVKLTLQYENHVNKMLPERQLLGFSRWFIYGMKNT